MLGTRIYAVLLMGAIALPPLETSAHGNTLTIGGTGAALGTMSRLGEAFAEENPGTEIEVLPSLGSGGGIKALSAGAIDLAVSARALKAKESAKGLRAAVYGTTALVFATRTEMAQPGLTSTDLVEIYAGDQRTWPGGSEIRPVLRPEVETDTKLISAHIEGMATALAAARARPAVPVLTTDQETADALERIPGSIGPTTLSLIASEGHRLRPLALDGVMPSESSIADGSYPITKTFYFVTQAERHDLVERFLAFAHSERGRRILRDNGHVIPTRTADQ